MAKSQGFVQKILAVLMLAIAVVLLVALLYKTKSSSEYSHVNTSLTTLRTMTTPGTASWSGNMMPGNRTYSDNAVGRPDASSSIERRNVCYGGWLHYSDDELRIVVNQFYIDVGYFAAGSRSAMGQIKVDYQQGIISFTVSDGSEIIVHVSPKVPINSLHYHEATSTEILIIGCLLNDTSVNTAYVITWRDGVTDEDVQCILAFVGERRSYVIRTYSREFGNNFKVIFPGGKVIDADLDRDAIIHKQVLTNLTTYEGNPSTISNPSGKCGC